MKKKNTKNNQSDKTELSLFKLIFKLNSWIELKGKYHFPLLSVQALGDSVE